MPLDCRFQVSFPPVGEACLESCVDFLEERASAYLLMGGTGF